MKRRHFLKYTTQGVLMPALLNGFGVKAYGSVWNHLLNPNTQTDNVLVLIQLAGGNDGLATLLPIDQYANLSNARSNIIIPQNQLLSLTGQNTLRLHPSMTGFQSLFNDGKIKAIQSVGYPDQDFSHFRSTDIWMTASSANEYINTGWAGRYLNYEYPNFPVGYPNTTMPDPLAIEIGYHQALTFQGPNMPMGMTISSATDFYNLLNNVTTPVPSTNAGDQLEYLRIIAQQTRQYSTAIKDAANRVPTQSSYPANNELAAKLKIVARLIAGGLKTRIYMVTLDGFDTHDSQVDYNNPLIGEHATLLKTLSDAVKSFMDDLSFLNIQNRVLGMTFSEFGRRIASNGSIGTDHGAAAPMFLFGNTVLGGVLGANPTIPSVVHWDDNVPMQYDFRSVYASVLSEWFCIPDADLDNLLLQNFQRMRLVNNPCTPTINTHEENVQNGKSLVDIYPNPFTESTNISFETQGGHTMIQIFDNSGRIVAMPVNQDYNAGAYKIGWNSEDLPTGTYYCRIQNGLTQQVKPMVKVR